jgi:sugar/nucleoside kinase (ribokinase family)
MKYDLMFIGPTTIDDNVDYTGEAVHAAGGAVYFCSFAARAAGARVFAAAKMNPADREIVQAFEDIPLAILPSAKTTWMRNVYHDATREKRESSVPAQSDPVLPAEIPDEPCSLYHLAGLLYGDFPLELITALSRRGLLAADMQGFLRHNEGGRLAFHDWAYKKDYLGYFDFVKVDANEAEILTGLQDRRAAAQQLHAWGAKEVFISFNEEMLAYDGKAFAAAPVKSRNLSGRTGRGDTVFASYLARRVLGDSMADAVRYATALVSLKMETPGPFRGTDADVRAFLREFY